VSHGFELEPSLAPGTLRPKNAVVSTLATALNVLNAMVLRISMLALVAAAGVLTWSVVTRYFLKTSTDWQDEVAVFLLVGATFMTTAHVQSLRGHVGIEAFTNLLPPLVNRARLFLVDIISALFCCFFSWKSLALFHEAWSEGQTTSSSFAPPLWIPYSLMAVGMSILTLQLFLQTVVHLTGGEVPKGKK
jgi:TRAP-type C4-dicarboxylate transport system permease small subunit